MTSHADRQGPRLLRLKRAQQQMSQAEAQAQQQLARAKRSEASDLREAAEQLLASARLPPEQGLSRSALFERLRVLAVARAHVLETGQAARELDADATGCDHREQVFHEAAAGHERKHRKLDHWQSTRQRELAHQRQRRQHLEQLEDYSCRRRSSR